MSVEISWETITSGVEGQELAEKIRNFVHDKFQQIHLPRFIKSVQVHSFAFGSACPEVEIKDISDPLPDFYEDDGSEESEEERPPLPDDSAAAPGQNSRSTAVSGHQHFPSLSTAPGLHSSIASDVNGRPLPGLSGRIGDLQSAHIPRSTTPGIPGGTSNFSYFHLPIGSLSGAHTPLANVAGGAPLTPLGWNQDLHHSSFAPFGGPLRLPTGGRTAQHDHVESSTRPSTADTIPSPPESSSPFNPSSPEWLPHLYPRAEKVSDDPTSELQGSFANDNAPSVQASDMQVVARVQYSGDVRMDLTAEILLDYPMPSFVGIPLKLSITGMRFDGVAILAYIRKRMHFCFLDPEDAHTLVGEHVVGPEQHGSKTGAAHGSLAGLLQEIHIESEIGRQEGGKQVLKNVGKVEKFVLEQIRRIFEDEFVFPSFWTFLV